MTPSQSPIPAGDPAANARRRRSTLILTVVAGLTVLVPFLFWKQTWFGEKLTDERIAEYIAATDKPRHMQQALVQIEERMERGDVSAARWYPLMAALKDSPVTELRVTLAWVLGSDNRSELFHETLLELLQDMDLLVRRNAALSLVRFGDASGREEIVRMLELHSATAGAAGVLRYRLEAGTSVDVGTLLARIERSDGTASELRSPAPGKLSSRDVPEGSPVTAGQQVATLAPADDHVWEGLRALLLIGRTEDLPLVESFAASAGDDYPNMIRDQAVLTAAEIRKRESAPR